MHRPDRRPLLLVAAYLDGTDRAHRRAAARGAAAFAGAFHLRDGGAIGRRRGVLGREGLVVGGGRGLIGCGLCVGFAPSEAVDDEADQEDQSGDCADDDACDGAAAEGAGAGAGRGCDGGR